MKPDPKKWKHASAYGMHLTGAMANGEGRVRLPHFYRARARAFMAEDLTAARDLRLRGFKDAARMRMVAARHDRIFITTGAPHLP